MPTISGVTDSRNYARTLLMMRRLVKEEFAVTVHLDEEEAAEELLAFASRSRHHLLRQMARELEEQMGEAPAAPVAAKEESPATATEKVSYYRGAPVVSESKPAATEAATSAGPKRIYRGQVVG